LRHTHSARQHLLVSGSKEKNSVTKTQPPLDFNAWLVLPPLICDIHLFRGNLPNTRAATSRDEALPHPSACDGVSPATVLMRIATMAALRSGFPPLLIGSAATSDAVHTHQ